jgi:DNA processing protein
MARTRELSCTLAVQGAEIVSGGAIGIDTAAHRGALDARRETVAVLGNGLDEPYPARNRPMFAEIVRSGGALLSPFAAGEPLARANFPRRNRVIAALADVVVVIEASVHSGSLYTASAARSYGRFLCACPGSPGTELLLAQGAHPVGSARDVWDVLSGVVKAAEVCAPAQGSDEEQALRALDLAVPHTAEWVGQVTGVGVLRAARALTALELEGFSLPTQGGRYVRSILGERALPPISIL